MTAAMNGSVNFSTDDGWVPEFAKPGKNSFVVPKADYKNMSTYDQDMYDLNKLYDLLENEIMTNYYDRPDEWRAITQQGMEDVRYAFASDRMADEYYREMYN